MSSLDNNISGMFNGKSIDPGALPQASTPSGCSTTVIFAPGSGR